MSHIHEKIDFTTDVFIVHKNRVLLRMHDKYKVWAGPGGHIELNEDPNQAIIREAKEEVGLDITLVDIGGYVKDLIKFPMGAFNHRELIPPAFLNRHQISDTHEHVDLVYLATANTDAIKPGSNEKEVQIKWFTKAELNDPRFGIRDHIRYYAQKALEILSP